MANFLKSDGINQYINLASPVVIASGQDFRIEEDVQAIDGPDFGIRLFGRPSTSAGRMIIAKGDNATMTTDLLITGIGAGKSILNRNVIALERVSNLVGGSVNGDPMNSTNTSSSGLTFQWLLSESSATNARNPANLYRKRVWINGVLAHDWNPSNLSLGWETIVDEVGGNHGTLVNYENAEAARGFYDAGGGTVPQGTAEIAVITPGETTASVAFTYGAADATEFDLYIDGVYESTTASSPALAADLTSGETYTAVIVPVNATGDGTPSAGVQFTTNAASPQVPQGTVTIGSITVGETTATVPYTYSAADQTGFEYRLNGGAAVADAASPVDLADLTENTPYTIEVRAVNANGPGAWSDVGNFTTDADAPADPVIVFGADTALTFNNGDAGLRRNLTGLSVDIYDATTRALVLSVTGHTSDANAVMANIQNAALAAATEYRIVVLGADGSEAVFRETSQ